MHLYEWGDPDAPTIVCLHGITAQGERFRRLAEERLAQRWHVVAPDLRGHGRSGYEPPWDLEQHLEDLLETAPADARLWVGHSFGGRLVLELAARHPERVDRAVLLDPAIWVPPPYALARAELQRHDRSWASIEAAAEERFADGGVRGGSRQVVEDDFRRHLEQDGDGRFRLRYCRSAVIAAFSVMARTPPQEQLTVPVHALRALESEVCPAQLAEAYAELAGPNFTHAEIPGGHIVMWDAFDETAEAIERFFGSSG
jgi:lipase